MERPHVNHDDHGVIPGPYRPWVFPAVQPRRLPPNNRDRPRTSARYQKVPTKPITLPMLHFRKQGDKESNIHSSTSGIPITDHESVDRLRTGGVPIYDTKYLQVLWGNRRNIPWVKFREYDGDIWPLITPLPPHCPTRNGSGVYKRIRADDCQFHDGVKRDYPSGTNFIF